ncbi:MAG: hypothetical protein A2591_03230 [Candidatus Yonathbacteria bacterium RIFOXYD1_FULL_52_36]|uniref:Uncharacterized protein n=1 Tax=Candidatus Yonathbacteria bacterium RIFOXYD1_FULL_52_36 TaxID=1802730 RepID=A0A1G2SHJ5_9BACT|nr:MAG: hypothetical protein A2591_03230 [Candidatus Yonathbacteria bacterium RIFOXYD1_FULL_52_36]
MMLTINGEHHVLTTPQAIEALDCAIRYVRRSYPRIDVITCHVVHGERRRQGKRVRANSPNIPFVDSILGSEDGGRKDWRSPLPAEMRTAIEEAVLLIFLEHLGMSLEDLAAQEHAVLPEIISA